MRKVLSMFVLLMLSISMLGSLSVYGIVPDGGISVAYNSNYTTEIQNALKEAALAGVQEDGKSFSKDSISGSDIVVYVKTNRTAKKGEITLPVFALDSLSETIRVYPDSFDQGESKQVRRVTQVFLDSLKDSSMPMDQQQSLMQEIQDVDT